MRGGRPRGRRGEHAIFRRPIEESHATAPVDEDEQQRVGLPGPLLLCANATAATSAGSCPLVRMGSGRVSADESVCTTTPYEGAARLSSLGAIRRRKQA